MIPIGPLAAVLMPIGPKFQLKCNMLLKIGRGLLESRGEMNKLFHCCRKCIVCIHINLFECKYENFKMVFENAIPVNNISPICFFLHILENGRDDKLSEINLKNVKKTVEGLFRPRNIHFLK
jgi:hypothetical protein